MVSEWCEFTFSELINRGALEIGDGYRAKISELGGDGPIFLRAGHVTDTHIDFAGVDRFHGGTSPAMASKMSRPGDVIVTTKGNSTGRVAFVNSSTPSFVYSPHLSYWRCLDQEKIVPGFLRYWSQSREFHNQLAGLAASTDMAPYLSLIDQRRLRIILPPPAEQRAISGVLSCLDDKIGLNRRMNETLEAMARAIFKSWFVDFDPVRAKSEGRQPFGMDAATAALFPNSFQDSALGKIPDRWQLTLLSEHIDAARGLSYTGEGLVEAGIPLHNLNSVLEGGGYKYEGIKHYAGEYEERHIVRPGDLIVTNTEQGFDFLLIGYPAIIPRCFRRLGLFSHHLFRVRPRAQSPLKPHFLYWLLMSHGMRSQIIGCTNGTTVNMLPSDALERPQFAVPSARLIDAFENIAAPLHERVEHNHEESQTLGRTRDALLPKLVSGRIRIGDAEGLTGTSI
jgi:type I restriction enzyme S subunit